MRNALTAALAIALLASSVALASHIAAESDRTADFSHFKTFAIRSGELNTKEAALNNGLLKKRIETDIERDLTARGLIMVSGNSDLDVHYYFGVEDKEEMVNRIVGGPLGRESSRLVLESHAKGTLVIVLLDPTTQLLVWRGIARETKDRALDIETKLDDIVRKVIEKYPPKKK